MKLTWGRTLIGGQTKPYDFAAKDSDAASAASIGTIPAARAHRWYWAMNAFGPDIDRRGVTCSGLVESKAVAVRTVEETYAVCLERPG